jgi:hypothetical protein
MSIEEKGAGSRMNNNNNNEPILTINSEGITIAKPITLTTNTDSLASICGKNLFDSALSIDTTNYSASIAADPTEYEPYEPHKSVWDKYRETVIKQERERRLKKILPRKWVINGPATILFWQDGTKTIVKCNKDDEFDAQKGYLMAFFEKTTGMSKHQIAKLMDEIK